ncbi:MAG: hypothetical protein ACJ71R_02005 [Nitrososphaeraceae archaeon]
MIRYSHGSILYLTFAVNHGRLRLASSRHRIITPMEVSSKLTILVCESCGMEVGKVEANSINIKIVDEDETIKGPVRRLTKQEREELKIKKIKEVVFRHYRLQCHNQKRHMLYENPRHL